MPPRSYYSAGRDQVGKVMLFTININQVRRFEFLRYRGLNQMDIN